jgi:hypothetical protein
MFITRVPWDHWEAVKPITRTTIDSFSHQVSTALAGAVVISAFQQRANFYSAMVYLAQSNFCLLVMPSPYCAMIFTIRTQCPLTPFYFAIVKGISELHPFSVQ